MSCEFCTDMDGEVLVPYYGMAPHQHRSIRGGHDGYITVLLPKEKWPKNFKADPDDPRMGMWWCLKCGEGRQE